MPHQQWESEFLDYKLPILMEDVFRLLYLQLLKALGNSNFRGKYHLKVQNFQTTTDKERKLAALNYHLPTYQ